MCMKLLLTSVNFFLLMGICINFPDKVGSITINGCWEYTTGTLKKVVMVQRTNKWVTFTHYSDTKLGAGCGKRTGETFF